MNYSKNTDNSCSLIAHFFNTCATGLVLKLLYTVGTANARFKKKSSCLAALCNQNIAQITCRKVEEILTFLRVQFAERQAGKEFWRFKNCGKIVAGVDLREVVGQRCPMR